MRYLALGDSYTIGESVAASERWPVQLTARLRARGLPIADPLLIATTGWTTGELAGAIEQANPIGPFDLVTLLIGVNNQYRGRSADEYRKQFHALLQRSIAYAGNDPARVIVLSIPDWSVTPFATGMGAEQSSLDRIAGQIDQFNAGTPQALREKLSAHFGADHGITFADSEEFWTDVTIDQARTPLSEVLNLIMTNFAVTDVRIVEISMENVVRKVYDGALG